MMELNILSLLNIDNDWTRGLGAPKAFLETQSWKFFLTGCIDVARRTKSEIVLWTPFFCPPDYTVVDQDHACSTIAYWLRESTDLFRTLLGVPETTDLVFDLQLTPPGRFPWSESDFVGSRSLADWVRSYMHGKAFSVRLGLERQERYTFIEELFQRPLFYDGILGSFFREGGGLTLLVGDPRAGKTYCSMKLLYDAFCKGYKNISLLQVPGLQEFASESTSDNEPLFIYVEDPFGKDQFELHQTARFIDAYNELCRHGRSLHMVITSREEVAKRALPYCGSRLNVADRFEFTVKDLTGVQRVYPLNALRRVLAGAAWLKGASWHEDYLRFINTEKKDEVSWDGVVSSDSAPGSLFNLLTLYPSILHFNGKSPGEIKALAKLAQKANDLKAAFNSELINAAAEIKSREKLGFLLLPCITLLSQDVLLRLFPDGADSVRTQFSGLLEERSSLDAFDKSSYRYVHDSLAEAARDYLLRYGREKLGESVMPWLAEMISDEKPDPIVERVVSDVLCTYFALGGTFGPDAQNWLQLLRTPQRREWVELTAVLLGAHTEDSEIVTSWVRRTANQPLPQISNVASLLDQLVRIDLETGRRAGQLYLEQILLGLMNEFEQSEAGVNDLALKESFLLHGLLSHIEEFAVQGLATVDLLERLWKRLDIGTLERRFHVGMVWLDAILMKIGELHSFLVTERDYAELVLGGDTAHLVTLKNELSRLFAMISLEVFGSSIASQEADELRGAMAFSAVWHNRWATGEFVNEEIRRWSEDAHLFKNIGHETAAYWRGVEANISYHSRYFELKAEAWERESAIYMWRRREPRLGASSLYESGLLPSDVENPIRVQHAEFFEKCGARLLFQERSLPLLSHASFILGMRAPRQSELAIALDQAIVSCVTWERDHQKAFWLGVALLYQHSFKDAEALIVRSLLSLTREGLSKSEQTLQEAVIERGGPTRGDLGKLASILS